MSIKFPPHLAAWEPQLRIFPPEIATGLAPMVQKLTALIGPLSGRHSEGLVLPDGFAGLAKRGIYERLIASDWLLADELPEEFMRRSVMGEHLFWKLAYLEPTQSRCTLAIFDAGPEQLGAPRIAHLAALAVLAARARNARAEFVWGILQNRAQDLLPGENFAELALLTQARGVLSAQPADFKLWLDHLAENRDFGEVWLIGSERTSQLAPPNFSCLTITDVLEPGARRLRVDCRPAGTHSCTIELELPEARFCAQLLRIPFVLAASPVQKSVHELLPGCLRFSATGRKLYSLTKDGSVLALPVPNSSREAAGKTKYYSANGAVAGVAQTRRSIWVVSVSSTVPHPNDENFGKLSFHVEQLGMPTTPTTGEYHSKFRSSSMTRKLLDQSTQLLPCVWYGGDHTSGAGIYLLDMSGILLRLFQSQGEKKFEIVKAEVLALTCSRLGLFYATYDEGRSRLSVAYGSMGQVLHYFDINPKPTRAFFGRGSQGDSPEYGLLALGYTEDYWEICKPGRREPLTVPPGFSVHGVIREDHYEAALIVIEDDHRTLSLLGAHGLRRLVTASSPITAVSGSHQHQHVAYSTEDGAIVIYLLPHRKPVLNFQGGSI